MDNGYITILIVEDNPGDVRLVSEMLKESPRQLFKLTSAGLVQDALNVLKDIKFDVILFDYNLPDSKELEGLEKITNLHPEIPVILLTGLDDEKVGMEAIKKNASDYIVKGKMDANLLVRSIKYAIERKKKEEELNSLNRTLFALSHSSQAIVSAADEKSYLREVCNIVVEDCGYSMVWIGYAEDDEEKTVRPAAYSGFEKGYLETLKITWNGSERGKGPTGTAIRTGKISLCRNMATDPKFLPWRSEALKRGYSSSIVFPLKAYTKVLGAITIYSNKPDSFSQDEVKLLSELADVLSYGITILRVKEAQLKAEQSLQRSEKQQSMMSNFAALLLEAEEPQRSIQNICQEAMKFLDCQFFFNFLFVEEENRLKLNSYHGIPVEEAKKIEWLDLGVAVCGCAALDRKRIIANNISCTKDQRTELVASYGVRAYCCHPLLVEDKLIGTISFGTNNRESFGVEEIAVMKSVSDLVAVAMRRKQAEDVLKRDKEAIEKLVSQRTQELLDAQFELEKSRRLSDIGTLATTVAHELRNPLAAISMAGYNIKRKAQNPNLDSHLATIDKKVNESNQIINNLLFYSRIKQPHYEKVDIKDILNECIESSYARHLGKQVKVNKKYENMKEVSLKADSLQMKELFGNILNNAFDAVSDKKGEVELLVKVQDSLITVVIKDNGIGIEKDVLQKVFDPFFSTKARGTGIGLSVSSQIVNLHMGTINIESEAGKGTSVLITLPAKH